MSEEPKILNKIRERINNTPVIRKKLYDSDRTNGTYEEFLSTDSFVERAKTKKQAIIWKRISPELDFISDVASKYECTNAIAIRQNTFETGTPSALSDEDKKIAKDMDDSTKAMYELKQKRCPLLMRIPIYIYKKGEQLVYLYIEKDIRKCKLDI